MKAMTMIRPFAAALALAALGGCAPPPKVLVANDFNGSDKMSKIMIQDSGATDPSTNAPIEMPPCTTTVDNPMTRPRSASGVCV